MGNAPGKARINKRGQIEIDPSAKIEGQESTDSQPLSEAHHENEDSNDKVDIPDRLQPFRLTIDDFQLLKVLGKGSFGKVFLVKKKGGPDDGALYAMKVLRKEVLLRRGQVEHTRAERAILQAVQHPFIVRLQYAFQTTDKLYLVTDVALGGELFFWLKRDKVFSQARMRLYAAELILALEALHSSDIVYRDLKPENILLDSEGHVKLTDFGLAKLGVWGFGSAGGTRTFCGTPEYLAPEILMNQGHGKAVDWWSLGTLLYEMIAGLPPFYSTNLETMYNAIVSAPIQWPRHFLPETVSFLSGLLTRRIEDRLGYNGASEIKSHPFFRGLDWDAVAERIVTPPFVPPRNGTISADPSGINDGINGNGEEEVDVSNFDGEFTAEPPVDSMAESARLSSTMAERAHFADFTFVGEGTQLSAAADAADSVEDGDSQFGGNGQWNRASFVHTE